MEPQSTVSFALPKSNLEIMAHEYNNGNWKLHCFNKNKNKMETLERSLSATQLQAFISLLIHSSDRHGLYGKTNADTITNLRKSIRLIKKNYGQLKNL